MFLIRRTVMEDVATLLKLAKMVHFINLPADQDIITGKVQHSRKSFMKAAAGAQAAESVEEQIPTPRRPDGSSLQGFSSAITQTDLFMFTLEDTETGAVLGSSQVVSCMSGPGRPSVSFQLSRKEFFSESLQTGTSHTVAKLYLDESGPSEIGGLILQPSFRNNKAKLGKLLGLIRFHFMALNRGLFADRVLAEMMAPISPDGTNLLWDYLGRRFISLSYTEADRFCQHSREFMTSLLPREEIYLSLLPPEARALVAQVGPETVPARKMLEKLGFEFHNFVDPFDGGPYLHADTDKISIVKDTQRVAFGGAEDEPKLDGYGYVSVLDADGEFRATQTDLAIRDGKLSLPGPVVDLLQVAPGDEMGYTPMPKPPTPKRRKRDRDAQASAG